MTENLCTPGPWKRGEPDEIYYCIFGADGDLVAAIGPNRSNAESDANALLIAAAPDLLAALKALSRLDNDGCWCDHAIGNPMMPGHSVACITARAALAKAEGR